MTSRPGDLLEMLGWAREETATVVAEIEGTVRAYADARGDADNDDEHDPEGSTLSWERAAAAASAAAAAQHLAEIDAAIARVGAGWDGACAGCGRPIPAERLAVRPSADRCVACAAAAPRG